jgi:hypothetical protein
MLVYHPVGHTFSCLPLHLVVQGGAFFLMLEGLLLLAHALSDAIYYM